MNINILISIIFLYSSTDALNYKEDYKYVDSLKTFYKVHKYSVNFSMANATCKAEGSKMLVPTSQNELIEVLKLTPKHMIQFWIVIHDVYSELEYVALYGIPFENVYIKWGFGEPNNMLYASGAYDEDCVMFTRNLKSYDIPCSHDYSLICKRELKGLTPNEACGNYDPKYKYIVELDRCYKFNNNLINWRNAFKTCKSEESYLLIINTDHEAEVVVNMFSQYPENNVLGILSKNIVYVGFNDMLTTGEYMTIKGEMLSETGYEKWAQSQPDNPHNQKRCGSMLRNGLLYTSNCDNVKALFICEKEIKRVQPTIL